MGQSTERVFLDTLAQSGTASSDHFTEYSERVVYGSGSDLADKDTLKARARRKLLTQRMVISLVDVAQKKGETERIQAYWNAYHCQNQLSSSGGRVYGKYCKNRFCTVCCAIRKAEIINRYLPEISTWEDPHFVTLTLKAVPAAKLDYWLEGIHRAFRQIREAAKKQNQRGQGIKLIGVKSLECNFNPVAKTYNPHLHLIVPNAEIAHALKKAWLKKWTPKLTSPKAQYIRRVENLERDLIETIKYGSKIFTEPDMQKKAKKKIPPKVYAAALDTIFCALKKHRLFDRFGFNLPKSSGRCKQPATFLEDCEEWRFRASHNDWLNEATGELMSGYIPSFQLLYLLGQNIDTELN